MTISHTEENYLKAIFKLAEKGQKSVSTNAIAAHMQTAAASVTDMLKRLAEKDLIAHEKYRGVQLSASGERMATALIRKHRLWEVFLTEKLGFSWDEVHDYAEQLEHVQGETLINRLDDFLGNPHFDPHGDPIPDAEGRWSFRPQALLATLQVGDKGVITGVEDHRPEFLQYLQQQGLVLGATLELLERFAFDQSVRIRAGATQIITLSEKATQNIYVKIS
ncbi:MAG: metal-dependent transcriptional regulator [Chitinophagales bacterium]|jgi:DtxR family transcriptional regulator, Mn-dependent transcriptional regulator|nr:metal-dependent transcriptional regulator [Chitinophagales bacterium]